ncbi:MAG TPA: ABC transporter permease [Kineosporiaceae bacterium]
MTRQVSRPGPAPHRVADLPAGWFAPGGAPAPPARRVLAQARFDATVLLRNGEQLLITLVLPALLLVALALTHVPDLGPGRRIDVAAPGVLALAVMSTAFTGQAIGTGFDRRYGVLRLLGTTPLGRGGLVAGRVLAVLGVEGAQVAALGALAAGLGWQPQGAGLAVGLVAVLAGTAAFVSLGLLLAGTLRSEAVLAVANLVWVLLLAGGGVVVPPDRLGAFAPVARVLPSGALGEALRGALQAGSVRWGAFGVLVAWAAVGSLATARWFSWD